ncbi:MAG: ATP-binding protein [Acidobacteriota bacterium]
MDTKTFESLRLALDASPDNLELRLVLVDAQAERRDAEGVRSLLAPLDPSDLRGEDRGRCARALLAVGDAEGALRHAVGDGPDLLMLRARALLELGRHDDGLAAYRRAVEANPALEDTDLRDRLAVNVRTFPRQVEGEGRPTLKVYSNDATDDTEVQRLLDPEREKVTFADVGGLGAVKKQIEKRIILPFQKPSLFRRFKKKVGGGILLYGPPGCGKTLLARATAGECDAEFLSVDIADVLDMYLGESESKLRAIFEKARASTPSVLFFDEIEALGGKRQYSREATSSKLVSQFLAEMDGFAQNNAGVLVLGATNVPWAVDPAFRRPGRFDRMMFVPPPDRDAREAILRLSLRGVPTADGVDFGFLAKRTSGFSGADLENLVDSAADLAIETSIETGEEVPVHDEHLRRSLGEVRATTLEWLTTARNYARYANEAGQYDDVLDFLKRHGK